MAPNGGFGELDNGYANLRTIRVKSDPAADDRVDGAPLGALHCSTARIPVRYPSRQPARWAKLASPLEGILWNARGRIGQENLRQPDCCQGRSGLGRLVVVLVFLPCLFESRRRGALNGLAFEP